jgi:hypothetical protein
MTMAATCNDIDEYEIHIDASATVQVTEIRIERAYGVERWGVGVGKNGRLLDYFEYARQRDQVTAFYYPIPSGASLYRPMPPSVHAAVLGHLRHIAQRRHASEASENL